MGTHATVVTLPTPKPQRSDGRWGHGRGAGRFAPGPLQRPQEQLTGEGLE